MATSAETTARPQFEKYLIEFLAVFLAYYVAGKIGQATTEIRSSNLGPVWPAYGVALAAVLLRGNRVLPAIALSAWLVASQSPVPQIAAAGQAIAATLAAFTGGVLLKRVNFDPAMSRLHDALNLIVLGGLTSSLVSSLLGTAVLFATGEQPYAGIGSAWLIYWLGDSTGVLLITPLVLTGAKLLEIRQPARIAEFLALFLVLVLACSTVFGGLSLFWAEPHAPSVAVLPLLMWAAIRFGVSGVSATTLVVAAIATVVTALGFGPLAHATTFTSAVLLDIFFAVLSASGVTLAAVIAEREHAEAARESLIRDQAAIEARLRVAEVIGSFAAALRESEDKLRLILDSAAEAIFGVDTEGRCTFCNQACLRILGYQSDQALLGRNMHELVQQAEGSARPHSPMTQVLQTGLGVHFDEEVLRKADGTSFPAEWWCFPQLKGDDVVGAVVGFSDITQRKQAEERAAMLRDELAHLNRVGMLSALTAALAHEINQPLTAIRVNAEAGLILLASKQPPLHEIGAALSEIRNDNQRAADVLRQVRTLLRKDTTGVERVEINSTVGDVVKLIGNSAARRGICIDAELAAETRPVRGDRIQVQQVVLNLLMNACDAVEQNEKPNRRVSLKTTAGDGAMVVQIRDTGVGLSNDEIARVFEPFFTTKNDGTGLGLWISRTIVDAYGGTLVAARNSERGMTFSASFPYWDKLPESPASGLARDLLPVSQ
jgi:PAS domain S-box-containing protein